MAERVASFTRETRETHVAVTLNLDGTGQGDVATNIGMLDHLIQQVSRHGLFDLSVRGSGDLHVDPHHTVEDIAIALGRALDRALGERLGLARMGHAIVPMDEALALVAVDLGGRGYAALDTPFKGEKVGELPTELVSHFLESLAREGRFTLHARLLTGDNDHHKAEAIFKALGKALDMATRLDERIPGQPPSTKGTVSS